VVVCDGVVSDVLERAECERSRENSSVAATVVSRGRGMQSGLRVVGAGG